MLTAPIFKIELELCSSPGHSDEEQPATYRLKVETHAIPGEQMTKDDTSHHTDKEAAYTAAVLAVGQAYVDLIAWDASPEDAAERLAPQRRETKP